MSEYFKSLDPAATDRYVARLQLLGIAKADDPFAPWNVMKFVDNMKLWPRVEYPHIFCYFMGRPGVRPGLYTRVDAVEKPECVQLFPEWACSSSRDLVCG